jgi:hypothetical protein
MGWEMRRGKRVYYRKIREAGRVRSVYCGAGERGEAAAREDEARRAGAAACATTESCGFTQHKKERTDFRTDKKEAESWPTVLEIVAVNGDYALLLDEYAPHTIPRDDEQLR